LEEVVRMVTRVTAKALTSCRTKRIGEFVAYWSICVQKPPKLESDPT